jgi:hypothetical protein
MTSSSAAKWIIIISEKHGGPTVAENLAYACTFCNCAKGSDIGSIVWHTGTFGRFFNPRTDRWAEHFVLDGVTIIPRSDMGEVTARLLDFNNPDRVVERQVVQAIGRYPSVSAILRMTEST